MENKDRFVGYIHGDHPGFITHHVYSTTVHFKQDPQYIQYLKSKQPSELSAFEKTVLKNEGKPSFTANIAYPLACVVAQWRKGNINATTKD